MDSTSGNITNQQSICQSCGMCCDGTLFGNAEIDASGPNPLWPTEVVQAISESNKLPQPCPAFQKNLCVIYPNRPNVCQGFSCILLNEYASGAIVLEEALSVVKAAKISRAAFFEAISELTGVEPNGTPDSLFAEFEDSFKEEFETAQFKRAHSKVFLIYARLQHQLKTRFHNSEKKSSANSAAKESSESASHE